ncbi:UDP-N-acetylmuramate dehydrogenase [Oceanispirochaeta crateris]|uniref:UDP-N-acetylenolpyruvoylglucosamine reductase n=1 Tax=Oceanispirochaeta crateris TaxID=2518645 RepID=A0A5C1QIP3_9SPIO|nr:UDP-N-acetylmuramate dehydrogenase [Oceanispirochaeta crateris]
MYRPAYYQYGHNCKLWVHSNTVQLVPQQGGESPAGAVHPNSSVSISQIYLTVLPCTGSPFIIVDVYKLIDLKRKINIRGSLREQESLKNLTSFRLGGKADLYAEPSDEEDLLHLLRALKEMEIPWFILGGGANILISDRGIRGMVISMTRLDSISKKESSLTLGAGLPVSDGAAYAADKGLKGLEFIYAMPGSVGGALWMNARCYGGEIAGILKGATIINENLEREYVPFKTNEWNYKKSPFQNRNCIILSAEFSLERAVPSDLWIEMKRIRKDREDKGHFRAPCAGSTFKNNRAFGAPSGQIIEDAGLKGYRIGGAAVSDWHGNILINEKDATAEELDKLIKFVQERVQEKTGFLLEPEVIRVGDWRSIDAESD